MLRNILPRIAVLAIALTVSPAWSPAWAGDAPMQIAGATTVDAEQIIELIQSKPDLVILDNRKESDYAAGHIEGAMRLIDTEVNAKTLAQHVPSKATPALFYCNGVTCGRAANAVQVAIKEGYSNVYYYALGMTEWNELKLPVVSQ